jgi:hypothetical protein
MIASATSATAAPILVDFNSDPAFANVANDFTHADSDKVFFSDTAGADLIIVPATLVPYGAVSGNGLGVFGDNDDSALRIDLRDGLVARSISLDFGYGQPLFSQGSDQAMLTVYRQGIQAAPSVVVALSQDGSHDGCQNGSIFWCIAFDGAAFDSAIFKFDVDPSLGLTEIVDNVNITPAIPEPSAALVFAVGALVLGGVHGRRSPTRGKHRGVGC